MTQRTFDEIIRRVVNADEIPVGSSPKTARDACDGDESDAIKALDIPD